MSVELSSVESVWPLFLASYCEPRSMPRRASTIGGGEYMTGDSLCQLHGLFGFAMMSWDWNENRILW